MTASRNRSRPRLALALCAGALLMGGASTALARDLEPVPSADDTPIATAPPEQTQPQPSAEPQAAPVKQKWTHLFVDDQDGMPDFSKVLARGGFIPVPIIITEPAVGNGGGLAAAFLSASPDHPREISRSVVGAFKTSNGSDGVILFHSGYAMDGRLSYRAGVGHGKVTLESFPGFAPGGIEYTSHYDYGLLASALWDLGGGFSVGPLFDFRKLSMEVDIQGLPQSFTDQFSEKMRTGAMGLGFHYDGRDNPLTPTTGGNAYIEGKFNSQIFGSQRDYQEYDAAGYAFGKLSSRFRYGLKLELNAIRGNYPVYYAPAINLRGVQALRYQGMETYSTETELTWQANPRWALLAFGGVGQSYADSARLYKDSGAIWTGGVGFRYRLARKFGFDAGADIAWGPDGATFYIQFGHAWSFKMD
ncbi:MAG: hypothetical protein J7515_09890 [Caulobacter sp.]|nr:hypothetical protein [Caulobacter sp.]